MSLSAFEGGITPLGNSPEIWLGHKDLKFAFLVPVNYTLVS